MVVLVFFIDLFDGLVFFMVDGFVVLVIEVFDFWFK